jgi:hypothetical protein
VSGGPVRASAVLASALGAAGGAVLANAVARPFMNVDGAIGCTPGGGPVVWMRGIALMGGSALAGGGGGAFGSVLDQLTEFDPRKFDWRESLKNIAIAAAMGAATGAAAGAAMWQARVCFVAGTPLLTPDGAKAIEQFRPGDLVLSRDEHNLEGEVEAKVVEEVFVNRGLVLDLTVGGRRIGTTGEHPFWVRGKGWLAANQIVAGDHIAGHAGRWAVVEKVETTQEFQTVYNLRIADYRTYFVGAIEWGFDLWAHNYDTQFKEEWKQWKSEYDQADAATQKTMLDEAYKGYKQRCEANGQTPVAPESFENLRATDRRTWKARESVADAKSAEGQQQRYQRYLAEGGTASFADWSPQAKNINTNKKTGTQEQRVLDELKLTNNNTEAAPADKRQASDYDSARKRFPSEPGVPDAVTDKFWIDVKTKGQGSQDTSVAYNDHLRAQVAGAGQDGGKNLAVIIQADSLSYKPAPNLQRSSATIFHFEPAAGGSGGTWHVWSGRGKNGQWVPTTQEQVRTTLGGDVLAPRTTS